MTNNNALEELKNINKVINELEISYTNDPLLMGKLDALKVYIRDLYSHSITPYASSYNVPNELLPTFYGGEKGIK